MTFPGKIGKPTHLNEEVLAALKEAILSGMPIVAACDYAKISQSSYYLWDKKGRRDLENGKDSVYANFYTDIRYVMAVKTKSLLNEIDEGVKNWQAKAWILERTRPLQFGRDSHILNEIRDLKDLVSQNQQKDEENGSSDNEKAE